jgi:hypothetical protein
MESNDAVRAMFDTLLENYIFYISPMYEFLHSQGQKRKSSKRAHHVRFSPESGQIADISRCPLCAMKQHMHCTKKER